MCAEEVSLPILTLGLPVVLPYWLILCVDRVTGTPAVRCLVTDLLSLAAPFPTASLSASSSAFWSSATDLG